MQLEDIRKIVSYSPSSGAFTWLVSRGGKAAAGSAAGHVNKRGYVQISIGCQKWLGHRLAWYMVHGEVPAQIDHINGVTNDNRIENLRKSTQAQNVTNTGLRSNNTSGFKGVSWCTYTNKWVAQIRQHGRKKTIGRYSSRELAHKAYCDEADKLFGEFARHG